ncbi:undecaprenyldiphospho-muramoylpentapeptide beta-N-acetylglucosaminyltransferase [Dielma fastidiosa]|uniref:UDP-N-acetylglucosamine--N-acetylmuramyl-(pentapeptide) pyrophosphoryl-undecaprenol N-acetylglucosamine transferase n=1 Tax=Dielma fastidiosa TaxID=1034346 RepID=A0AB35UQ47_9FIRM|nr:undecaprenyldiphospho-muramoylpentapeptide beta-N-acetylglucosaminyltransferase [Dielma fastidiosa]MDY5167636.1 undecaprenyldiphospho-muramoylpentapeptide beta-N-acetylglucosaminyltransferase [Dielma fastidiosa]
MKILIATGGTGGHIYPALALADAACKQNPKTEILFIGNHDRMEAKEIPAHGYAFKGLNASGLTGNVFNKIKAVTLMGIAFTKANKIVKEFKPDIAVGFGGYVSAPVMMAAHHNHVPVMLHEQNSIVGAANKLCARFADAIVLCYEKCFDELGREKTRLLGNPRASIAKQSVFDEAYYKSLGLSMDKPLVLIVMGSLGSTSVNEAMVTALKEMKADIQILYVSGKQNYETMKNKFSNKNIKVVDYVNQIAIMEKVDCIICRAGATTAAEITAFGIPAILIPSPYVANNHQYYNAKVLVDKKCAYMIEEKDLNGKLLFEKLSRIMNNSKLREEMHENMLKNGFVNASDDILTWMKELVG